MKIRLATIDDMPTLREIFNFGRQMQLRTGNLDQWEAGYPSQMLMLDDIAKDAAHVCIVDDQIVGTFSLFTEPDPTYEKIDGEWLNDAPYATIHRIATNGEVRQVGQDCIEWIKERHDNIRIDTHKDNSLMIHVLEKLGFERCGVIYLENGDPREAYQYVKE